MALDMRFSWSHATDSLWMRIDPELWHTTHNPWLILQTTAASHLEALADDPAFVDEVTKQLRCYQQAMESESWFDHSKNRDTFNFIAYFCMEYGLAEALPIYSGGLGILAGDYLKAASDVGLPVAGIGLLYQQGYFRQIVDAHACSLDTALTTTRVGNLFTTHTPVPAGFDRFSPDLMHHYMSPYCKELGLSIRDVLATGRVDPSDSRAPFNMAVLAMHGCGAANGVSRLHGEVSRNIFQPLFSQWPGNEVPAGHVTNGIHVPSWDSAGADSLWTDACGKERWLGEMNNLTEKIQSLPDESLWTLRARSRKQFVHFVRQEHTRQFTIEGVSTDESAAMGSVLDSNALTLCFARRFAVYKRPNLLLTDPVRLARILSNREYPLQLVIAGKAHPQDKPGKAMIRQWITFIHDYHLEANVIFLSDYDMMMAEQMVQGADIWLNTPRHPWEACGTSGMKVLVNGGLNLSELDGWWAEAYTPDVGWAVGDGREHDSDPDWDVAEANEIYRLLENEIIPCFYERDERGIPVHWVARMRASMAQLTPQFSCNRMLQEYITKYYRPLAVAWRKRKNNHQIAEGINAWRKRLAYHWHKVHFGNVCHHEKDDIHSFEVQVYLDELDKDDVQVQLYADNDGNAEGECISMQRGEGLAGAVHGYVFHADFPSTRPAGDYTPRIIPCHPEAMVPIEASQILWLK